jgi:PHD/YefM family antitoxin component YafN of YafNO toxin-antitoxin module
MRQKLFQREEFASIQEIQAGTSKLLRGAAARGSFIRVLKSSKPLGVLMPNSTFESLTEDLLALSSPSYMMGIKNARSERKRYSSKEVKKMLGL